MKSTRMLPLMFLAVSAAAVVAAEPPVYQIDSSHSGASFSIRHLMVTNVKGQFSKVTGTVRYDPQNPGASYVDATIDVNTIDTREEKRDAHLKSADFFDAARFPTMRFVSKRVMPAGPGKLKLLGDLTIHGVTREVTLDVEGPAPELKDPWGNLRTGASASTTINRKDFGLTWNKTLETGGVMVGEDVLINIDVALVRKQS